MMDEAVVRAWAREHLCEPLDVDCVTAVMLKILDGKCRMGEQDKRVSAILYDVLKDCPGQLLDMAVRGLIAEAGGQSDIALREQIYEQRLYAESMIGRPVMKAYKARLRAAGLLGSN